MKKEKSEYAPMPYITDCPICGVKFDANTGGKDGNWKRFCDSCDKESPSKETLFFFYGSLRKGLYNHKPYEDKVEFIGTADIHGYRLISLGSYPCVVKTGNSEDFVVGEVYKVTDDSAIRSIDMMEINAGYKRSFEKVNIRNDDGLDPDSKEVLLYEFRFPERVENKPTVEHGDWVKFVNERVGVSK